MTNQGFPDHVVGCICVLFFSLSACGTVTNPDIQVPFGTHQRTDAVSVVDAVQSPMPPVPPGPLQPTDTVSIVDTPEDPTLPDSTVDPPKNDPPDNPSPVCGDGICSTEEDETSCPNDCFSSTSPPPDPPAPPIVAECGLIAQANPAWEVCETSSTTCNGVFADGAGCQAYCAAAGMECIARFGGEPGCQKEPGNSIPCLANTGHSSDWCECGNPTGTPAPPTTPPPTDPGMLTGECSPSPGNLAVGATYTLNIDAFTGDEHTTQPKSDANNGQSGDNPLFRRHNVARGHADYWYSSSHQKAGEPDPNGPQWVDYTPDFDQLGRGCYRITAQYRGTNNRALYPALYRVLNTANGDHLYEHVQKRLDGAYVDEDLGTHQMCGASFVRIEDPGPNSISMNKMRFKYLGPTCP